MAFRAPDRFDVRDAERGRVVVGVSDLPRRDRDARTAPGRSLHLPAQSSDVLAEAREAAGPVRWVVRHPALPNTSRPRCAVPSSGRSSPLLRTLRHGVAVPVTASSGQPGSAKPARIGPISSTMSTQQPVGVLRLVLQCHLALRARGHLGRLRRL